MLLHQSQYCYGDSGCDTFDRIVASKVQDEKVVRTYPLCAYLAVANYKGIGDLNEAANFVCVKDSVR